MSDQDFRSEPSAQIAPVPRISIQAFCEGADIAAVLQDAMADRRMNKAHMKVHMGGAAAAVEAYRNAPTPNLIIIESAGDRATLVGQLEELAEFCDAGTKVVVVGRVNDIVLYRDLISRGVSDYLVAPFSVVEVIRSISELYTSGTSAPLGRVIAVTSAKGGAGASTVAHNLAWSIATDHELSTILVDMDLGFGTAGLDFNQDPPQGVAEAIFAPERLDQNFVDRLLSKCGDNLSMLAAPATLERSYDIAETAFDPLIDILRATTPVAVLDVPHAWNAWTRRILVGADEVVVVASPELASLRNAKNVFDQLRAARPNDHPAKLVLNNVGVLKRPEIAPADFGKSVEAEASTIIPFDAKLFGTAANNGQMIAEVDAASKVAESFSDLARQLLGRSEAKKPKKTLLQPLLARLSRKKA
ncbi:MAG: AAA family ATPase [Methylobacteriaceae bacterium]|nr:AAA family ATPase [Methylobacteriaceae bacterium]